MELTSMLIYVAIFVIVVSLLYYYGSKSARRLQATFPGLPGPKPLPFIGHLLDFLKTNGQLHLFFNANLKKYGRLYSMAFGGFPSIVTTDPEMIKEILVKKFECFHDRPQTMKFPNPLNKTLFSIPGADWKRIRATVSPSFSTHKLKEMTSLMNIACDVLLRKIDEAAESGKTFDIASYQQAVTLDVIMSAAFGIQSNFQSSPDDPIIQTALRAMKPTNFQQFVLNIVVPLLPYGRDFAASNIGKNFFFKDALTLSEVARKVIHIRRHGEVRKDLMDLMLNATAENKKLSDDEIVAQSVIFLLAGYETSSTTLGMVCYHLATNPDVQERLQKEIDSVWTCEDNMPSYDTMHELPYLDMVISETLRHCPPAFFLMRECTKECSIKGLKIPKNTIVLIPNYTLHMDPEYFPDPDKFDPERFSAVAKQSRDPYSYLPFSHGPRNCVGMRFAQMEVKLVLVRLLKKYSFVLTPETPVPMKLEAKLTLGPEAGSIILAAKKRNI